MLTRLKPSNQALTVIATADIETSSTGELLDANLAYGDEYRTCTSWLEWLDCLEVAHDSYHIGHVWFHNGGRFDLVGFLRLLISGAFRDRISGDWRTKVIGGSIIEIDFQFVGRKRKKRRVRLADSFRLLPVSLDSLCGSKGFNLGHTKDDVPDDYKSHMEAYKKDYPEKYHEYHKNDTLLLLRILTIFRDYVNQLAAIGNLRLTCGATALAVFRTGFLDRDIATPGETEREFTRKAYQGGRCEYVGDGVLKANHNCTYEGVKTYDINSEYPWAMWGYEFPVSPGVYVEKYTGGWEAGGGELLPGCYRVWFRQVHGRMALIKPIKISGGPEKNAIWQGEAYITHLEANEIIRGGGKVEVIEGYVYPETAPIFYSFVDTLYARRLENAARGNAAMVLVIKLIMNNLYGKFGQGELREGFQVLSYDDFAALDAQLDREAGEEIVALPHISEDAYLVKQRHAVPHGFPAIAAMITARGRLRVLEIPNRYGIPILYCDTDCVHVQCELPEHLIDAKELGKFKREATGEFVYGGRKIYVNTSEMKHKAKGAPSKAVNVSSLYKALEAGVPFRVPYSAPVGIKTALNRNIVNPNAFVAQFRTIQRAPSSFEAGLLHTDWNAE